MTVQGLEHMELTGSVAVDALVGEVGNWPGVEVVPHARFGGPAFQVGRRQLGHLHDAGDRGAFADIPLPRALRDELIESGRARPHSAMPDSGWLTVPVRSAADLGDAVQVFRLAYERARNKAVRGESPVPGLYASPPEPLPFDRSLEIRSFLLRRSRGDILVYNSPRAPAGDPERQYLNHRHEAGFGPARAQLFVHESERDSVAEHLHIRGTFSRRHLLDDDFEVVPTPGHTPGATAYLWDSGEHRFLFTGDTILLRDGEWRGAVLGSSDREAYLRSLDLIRELDFDVLVPWAASSSEPYVAVTSHAEARRRIDAIAARVRGGADG
jgi:Family of unknown function (DUF5519)/Metallo-beta-lactamase superfamily